MAEVKKVGLIGWPADYSLSPAMHNAAFKALGIDGEWHYDLLPTPPNELKARVETLIERGYVGANVTVPHKQSIIPMLSGGVVLAARGINAINTIVLDNGKLQGHNTDVYGIRADLEAHDVELKGSKALILGAGGAAHAAALSLANAGASITVMNRHSQRAWDLYRNIRGKTASELAITVQELSALERLAPQMTLIINCTPAGMSPVHSDMSPWPREVAIPASATVYDMVYRPAVTKFMQQALQAGARAIGGLGMLVYQGAAAFQLWTGQDPDIRVMRQAAEQALENSEREIYD
jgi:shikimate dehydrogenase